MGFDEIYAGAKGSEQCLMFCGVKNGDVISEYAHFKLVDASSSDMVNMACAVALSLGRFMRDNFDVDAIGQEKVGEFFAKYFMIGAFEGNPADGHGTMFDSVQ